MTDDKDFEKNEAPSGAEGSEAHASDPASQDEELTVDDILGAAQSEDAAAADVDAEGADEATDGHLADLQRLTAEYANYRRRTDANREVEKQRAKRDVLSGLLPVLDDFDRAEKHGDLAEGSAFAVIADKIRTLVSRQGVETYGEVGEVFDPQRHEAIFQQPTPGATESTILDVVEVGYRLGDVELRPAKVVVAVPAE
ncbi:nucleotide exchange factor GrpE [Microbacterium gorillae]|uniref:nucleotide exchange factor GrpE n=1 Tax=Microbacterium gorillae TaxID=1231063 RepID=UPI000590160E|nr:nucleotide exchange factor GrpE [Microbacterium gorillae]